MSEETWVSNVIQKVQEQNTQIDQSWFALMKNLLDGQLSEKPLSKGELTSNADALIQAIILEEPKKQSDQ